MMGTRLACMCLSYNNDTGGIPLTGGTYSQQTFHSHQGVSQKSGRKRAEFFVRAISLFNNWRQPADTVEWPYAITLFLLSMCVYIHMQIYLDIFIYHIGTYWKHDFPRMAWKCVSMYGNVFLFYCRKTWPVGFNMTEMKNSRSSCLTMIV